VEEPPPTPLKKIPSIPKQAPKSISIKDALAGTTVVNQPKLESEKLSEDDYVADDENFDEVGDENQNTFGQDELEETWQKFIKTYLNDRPRYSSLMENYLPTLKLDFTIGVEVESSLQVEMFNELKSEITQFLHSELGNRAITLDFKEVANDNANGKLYTVEDKLKYLSQLNPSIIKLKQQLNLDFD
jgi:hypothetical protein